MLTESDGADIDSPEETLTPSKLATQRLQQEQLFLGNFLAIWIKCKNALKKLSGSLPAAVIKHMERLEKSTSYKTGSRKGQEHLPPLFEYPVILAAIFMDPRYFTYLDEEQVQVAKDHLEKLWTRMEAMRKKWESTEEEVETPSDTDKEVDMGSDSEDSGGKDEFDSFLKQKNAARITSLQERAAIRTILDTYYANTEMVSAKTNILHWWHDKRVTHPELYALSSVALAVPATQVSVERLFSSLTFIFDPLRRNMDTSFLNDLLVLRNNKIFKRKEGTEKSKSSGISEDIANIASTSHSQSSFSE